MRLFKLLTVLVLLIFCGSDINATEMGANPFMESKKLYVIKNTVDLEGHAVTIPAGRTIIFKRKGRIINGTLNGNNTVVKADRHQIFDDVVLVGTFSAKMAYSEWFGAKSDCVLDGNNKYVSGTNNLQAFKNLFCFDNVLIKQGSYLIEGGVLSCRSNQTIKGNNATLKFLTKKYCINIEGLDRDPVTNVTIRDLSIVGCKYEFDDITQWWHGVNIGFANNILVENVTCAACRGDGFYIGNYIYTEHNEKIPQNIVLDKVKASHNYRNGLSITRAVNVTVSNSQFCHTSGTLPEAGIDIEPNKVIENGEVVNIGELENINIIKCSFFGNNNEGLLIANQISTKPSVPLIRWLEVTDCEFDDDDITITGCEDSRFEYLDLKNSVVKVNGESYIKNLTLSNFKMVEVEAVNDKVAIDLEYYRSKDWPVRSNIVISDMIIDGYGGGAIKVGQGNLITYKKFDGLTISKCKINNCGKGIELGKSIKNLQFYDNKVDGNNVSPESVQLMGISVLLFLLLATGGLAFLIKRKN